MRSIVTPALLIKFCQIGLCFALAIAIPAPTFANPISQQQATSRLLAQAAPTLTQIRLTTVAGEVKILVETVDGKTLTGTVRSASDRSIVTIPNVQLSSEFRQNNPGNGINAIVGTNATPTTIEIAIIGNPGIAIESNIATGNAGLTIDISSIIEQEITVTAQKRQDAVQNVPQSITVIPQRQIQDARIDSIQGIANNTPNFNFLPGGTGASYASTYSLRGLSNFNFLASQDNVAFYIDDVPYDYSGFLNGTLFDLERIEVLRGPQSTLYGRSSQAGVVNIISRAPTNQQEIRTEASFGSYNARNLQLSFSDALVPDKVFFRVAGISKTRDGIVRNTALDRNVGEKNGLAGRAEVLWTPSPEWKVSLNTTASADRDGSAILNARDAIDPFTISQNFNGFSRLDNNTQALKVAYEGSGLRAVAVTTRRGTNQDFAAGYPGVDLYSGVGAFNSTVLTQEVRFQSPKTEDKLRWLAGGYFESRDFNTIRDGIDLTSQGAAAFGLPAPGINNVSAEQQRRTYAAFGQVDYKPIEPLTLIAGLRYESSSVTMARRRNFLTAGGSVPLVPEVSGLTERSEDLIPRIGAQYRFNPNLMAYANVAKGYRPSGFNYRADTEATRRFQEESTWNYELGVKSSWLNNRLSANLAFFQTDANGYQIALPDATGAFNNIASANLKINGLELEVKAKPIDGLELIAGLGYTDAKFKNYTNPFTGQSFNDNRVPIAPSVTYNLAAQYRSLGGIFARTELVGTGLTFFDDANTIDQKPYALVNARVGYENENWGAYLFANNLFNTRYITSGFVFPPPNVVASFGEPTTYGIQVRANF